MNSKRSKRKKKANKISTRQRSGKESTRDTSAFFTSVRRRDERVERRPSRSGDELKMVINHSEESPLVTVTYRICAVLSMYGWIAVACVWSDCDGSWYVRVHIAIAVLLTATRPYAQTHTQKLRVRE